MKKSNHSKIKNVGLIFDLLTRHMTRDVMEGKSNSAAQSILYEFFKKDSLLTKELELYTALAESKSVPDKKAHYLIDEVIAAHKKLNIRDLKRERYNLIKRINEKFDATFFKCHVPSYKYLAAIYRLLESAHNSFSPAELVESRFTIVEHLSKKTPVIKEEKAMSAEEQDIQILAYKLLIEKFNQKYAHLSLEQREVLRQYIKNVSNTSTLRQFVIDSAKRIIPLYEGKIKQIQDVSLKVKLTEMSNLLQKLTQIKFATDDHVQSLLLHYEIMKELKND